MELLDAFPLPLALALLALLDGLSVGTLLLPVFFLLAPGRPRVARILLYLATITLFYLVVGVLCMLGLVNLIDVGSAFLASDAGRVALTCLGAAMLAAGIWIGVVDDRAKRAAKARSAAGGGAAGGSDGHALGGTGIGPRSSVALAPAAAGQDSRPRPGRIVRWRDRILDPGTGRAAIMGVALAAGLVEVATMLPYLVGMTLLAGADLTMPARYAMLAGYCVVMIVPALALLGARLAAAKRIEPLLQRLATWMQRTGAENTSWVLGIVGFIMMTRSARALGVTSASEFFQLLGLG